MTRLCDQIAALLLNAGASPEFALRQALSLLLAELHSQTVTVHRLEPHARLLRLVAQIGLPPAMVEIVRVIPVGKGIAGQTAERGEPVTICNLQSDDSGVAPPGARQSGVAGALSVPLRHGPSIVGTIGIGTVQQRQYTSDEMRALEEIGRVVGAYLSKDGPARGVRG